MRTILASRIKRERRRCRLTQDDLASMLRPYFPSRNYPSRATVANWEIDRAEVPAEVLPWLARLFNVTTDYLLGLPAQTADNDRPTEDHLPAAKAAIDRLAAANRLPVGGARGRRASRKGR